MCTTTSSGVVLEWINLSESCLDMILYTTSTSVIYNINFRHWYPNWLVTRGCTYFVNDNILATPSRALQRRYMLWWLCNTLSRVRIYLGRRRKNYRRTFRRMVSDKSTKVVNVVLTSPAAPSSLNWSIPYSDITFIITHFWYHCNYMQD
jgi:hypothetical protein